jgi:moderate conductance mechanosensitive channel
MDKFFAFLAGINLEALVDRALHIMIILIAAWVGSKIVRKLLIRFQAILVQQGKTSGETATESSKRIETLMRLMRQAAYITLWIIATLMIVKEIGIEIGPILAGAGVLGLAVGFGAQNLVKDVISGFFLILENQVRIGDVVSINGTSGLVERINFRTIMLRDLAGVVHIIPNGTITYLSNMTYEWSAYVFDIGVAYREDLNRVIDTLKQTGERMKLEQPYGDLIIGDLEIFGVDKFDESAVVIKGRIRTKPIRQWEVGREFLKRVKYAFDEQGIEIPFPQRVVSFSGDNVLRMPGGMNTPPE